MKLYFVRLGFDAKKAPEDLECHVVARNMAAVEKHFKDVDEIKLVDDQVTIIKMKVE